MPDPISEQIAASVVTALENIQEGMPFTTPQSSGVFQTTLAGVTRATADKESINTADRQAVLWDFSVKPEKPVKVPYGVQAWTHLFEIRVYIRESKNSNTPISRRINLARADVESALMSDPRRGGLCWIDNQIEDIGVVSDADSGVYSFAVVLLCEYRTVRGDPTKLAPSATNEQFFQGGAVVMLAPYLSDGRTVGVWRRLQDLRVTPHLEPSTEKISSDQTDGLTRPIDESYTGHNLKFTAESDFQNQDILAWRFGAGAVTETTKAAQSLAAVPHLVRSTDSIVPLHDANQAPLFLVSAVSAVKDTAGVITYVAGVDYIADQQSLRQGVILIPPTSAIPANGMVLIDLATQALTSRPAFDPGTAEQTRYRARIIWAASDGQMLVYGDFDASIVATATTEDVASATTTTLTISVLDDGSATPCGQFLSAAGTVPAVGF